MEDISSPVEGYTIQIDDKCILLKCGKGAMWLSADMVKWIAENGEDYLSVLALKET